MDDRQFDSLARRVAAGTTRRQMLRGLLGFTGALVATSVGKPGSADAARRGYSGPSVPLPPPGCAPVCDGQTCGGPDGCGGTCGCGRYGVCHGGWCFQQTDAYCSTCGPCTCGHSGGVNYCGGPFYLIDCATQGCNSGYYCDAQRGACVLPCYR